jgi:tRNA(Ile)-lysidine synthase TilS/MesJ
MNPGYRKENIEKIINNSKLLNIDIEIYESDIFAVAEKLNKEKPCYMCARMRRGFLYNKAQELGCNKIALGHHFNDVIETVLMSMTYSSEIKTMLPKLHSTNFEGMELIRPLYKVKEKDIINWAEYNGFKFLQCACKMTEKNADIELTSKRKEIKQLIADIKEQNPEADDNIFRSLHNVNMATMPGWRDSDSGDLHSFLEKY